MKILNWNNDELESQQGVLEGEDNISAYSSLSSSLNESNSSKIISSHSRTFSLKEFKTSEILEPLKIIENELPTVYPQISDLPFQRIQQMKQIFNKEYPSEYRKFKQKMK